MSGNDDADNNDQYETSTGQSPALMRSNKDQGAIGSRSSPKKGASDNRKRGRSKKRKREYSKKRRRYSSTSSSSASGSHSPERKWKKASKKRRKHRRKKSSSSSNESDTKPFKVISETDKYKYNLPTKMANYANEQFHSYVKDTDIKQQILLTNPIPENLNKAKKLDEFVKDILKEKHKQKDMDQDATFERIQCKNVNVMRPLPKV